MTSESGELEREVTRTDDCDCDERPTTEQWARVRARLQVEVSGMDYHTWLRQIGFAGIDVDEVMLQMPTRFLRDEVRSRFGDTLNKLWQQENRQIRRVDIRVAANGAVVPVQSSTSSALIVV